MTKSAWWKHANWKTFYPLITLTPSSFALLAKLRLISTNAIILSQAKTYKVKLNWFLPAIRDYTQPPLKVLHARHSIKPHRISGVAHTPSITDADSATDAAVGISPPPFPACNAINLVFPFLCNVQCQLSRFATSVRSG